MAEDTPLHYINSTHWKKMMEEEVQSEAKRSWLSAHMLGIRSSLKFLIAFAYYEDLIASVVMCTFACFKMS